MCSDEAKAKDGELSKAATELIDKMRRGGSGASCLGPFRCGHWVVGKRKTTLCMEFIHLGCNMVDIGSSFGYLMFWV